MLTPLDHNSDDYSNQEVSINFTIHRIQEGLGNYEFPNEHNVGIKYGMRPLHYYVNYLKHDQYPHPAVLQYIGEVFKRIIDGEDFITAFGLERGKGRRPDDEIAEIRQKKEKIGLMMLNMLTRQSIGKTLKELTREISKEYGMSEESVKRAYYAAKKDYELGQEAGRRINRERAAKRE